ncbi:hypothetical protein BO85DRAFT_300184 [Aspergillus piperis CBS 112811]|uniref:Uncharacterized protein n=1 Tax=Aspergillus piperis CBS 112811 TaxID=1448313 RepID=A0A8G1R0R5_9EURO|nr:hypothetical protein BO85DRAFT_300184 [Aspergillus piperis CBS 112811]RAH57418.1 hypothetical protein BO85DRAFT_300184 [Aspergillus piperis CBS 112811]
MSAYKARDTGSLLYTGYYYYYSTGSAMIGCQSSSVGTQGTIDKPEYGNKAEQLESLNRVEVFVRWPLGIERE